LRKAISRADTALFLLRAAFLTFSEISRIAKASRFRQSLRRRRALVDQRARFLLFCEGRNSEPLYFHTLARTLKRTVIDLKKAAGSPDTIAAKAIEEARVQGLLSKRRAAGAVSDQVWAIFDRDQHEHFEEAVRKCEQNGIRVARSNPCFEIWLILHLEDFDRPDDRDHVFEHFCKLKPDYKDGKGRKCDFTQLIQSAQAAEERAVRQLAAREAEGSPFGPPSTTAYELTRVLRTRG
jgi:RloB-like protein